MGANEVFGSHRHARAADARLRRTPTCKDPEGNAWTFGTCDPWADVEAGPATNDSHAERQRALVQSLSPFKAEVAKIPTMKAGLWAAAGSIPIDTPPQRKDTHWLVWQAGECQQARHTPCSATMQRGLAMGRRSGQLAGQDLS